MVFEKQGLQENLRRISLVFSGVIWAAESLARPERLKIAYGSTRWHLGSDFPIEHVTTVTLQCEHGREECPLGQSIFHGSRRYRGIAKGFRKENALTSQTLMGTTITWESC